MVNYTYYDILNNRTLQIKLSTEEVNLMKILIVYPPNQLMPIETPRPDGSLGPLYLAGALREISIEADIVDMSVGTSKDNLQDTFYRNELQSNGLVRIGMSRERIAETVSGYDLICIHSNFTPQTKMAFEVAKIVRQVNPDTFIIAGGVNARSLWPRFLKTGLFDLICLTEGEEIIKEIARGKFWGIPGTVAYVEGRPILASARPAVINLDELPFPAWDKLPFEKYELIDSPHGVDLTSQRQRYAPIMTSRGCPFRCTYCHISKEKEEHLGIGDLRLKSVDRVLQEIEILRRLGVTKLFIEDDSLLAKKTRIKELFTAIINLGLTIAGVNGVNLVHFFQKVGSKLEPDQEYMELLANAGFRQIVFPVESGSQRVLNKYATAKLNLNTMEVLKLTRIATEIGIICPINMMIGFPDETEQEMMQSIELAKKLIDCGAPYVTFFIPIPFPGSQLYDIAIRGKYLRSDFDPDIMNWKNGVMENTTVSKERIVELRDWAWENINPSEHIRKRLQESMKSRIAG